MYIRAKEIIAIRKELQQGTQPWTTAYTTFIARANRALTGPVYSVVNQGTTPPNLSRNDYYTERSYCGWTNVDGKEPDCRDGQFNVQADRRDYQVLRNMSGAVRDLALAYQLTGQSRYADKAIKLIHAWSVEPRTKMSPKFSNNQAWIDFAVNLTSMLYGADLVYHYPDWERTSKDAFLNWISILARNAKEETFENNFENWRINFIAAAGALLEDRTLLSYAFQRFKEFIHEQIDPAGRMITETDRTNSLTYSLFALTAMMQVAEIARNYDTDLYEYKTGDGRGLKLALDFHNYYMLHPDKWPFQQITPYEGDYDGLYELGYSYWRQNSYFEIIAKQGRPMGLSVLGPVTLTHANRFELDLDETSLEPRPAFQSIVIPGARLNILISVPIPSNIPSVTWSTVTSRSAAWPRSDREVVPFLVG